jgi:hypothetical protein
MGCFYRNRLAELAQADKSIVELAESFRAEGEIQDGHSEFRVLISKM